MSSAPCCFWSLSAWSSPWTCILTVPGGGSPPCSVGGTGHRPQEPVILVPPERPLPRAFSSSSSPEAPGGLISPPPRHRLLVLRSLSPVNATAWSGVACAVFLMVFTELRLVTCLPAMQVPLAPNCFHNFLFVFFFLSISLLTFLIDDHGKHVITSTDTEKALDKVSSHSLSKHFNWWLQADGNAVGF